MLQYLMNDPAAVERARVGASAFAYPVPGSENAAWAWWVLTEAGVRTPLTPDPALLLALLLMRGLITLRPDERLRPADLCVWYVDGQPRIGVAAKVSTDGTFAQVVDESVGGEVRSRRMMRSEMAYLVRIPGGGG